MLQAAKKLALLIALLALPVNASALTQSLSQTRVTGSSHLATEYHQATNDLTAQLHRENHRVSTTVASESPLFAKVLQEAVESGGVQGGSGARVTGDVVTEAATKGVPALAKRTGSVNVLGKAYPKEIGFADELANAGHNVVVRGKGAQGADLLVDGVQWELKTLESGTINAIRQNLRKGLKQGAGRVFIDGRGAGLTHGNAIRALRQHSNAGRMGSAVEVRVLTRSGQYVWTP